MPRAIFAIACLGVLVGFAGCNGEGKTSDADVQQVTEPDLRTYLGERGTLLLDVRKPELYRQGHLPGAINIFLADLRQRDPRLDDAERIVVYAGGWTDPLSGSGVKQLIKLGYTDVYEFKGGVEVWEDSGGQLVRQDGPGGTGRPETGQ